MFHLPNTLVFTSTFHNNSLPEDGRIHLRINKARISPNADEVVKLANFWRHIKRRIFGDKFVTICSLNEEIWCDCKMRTVDD